MTALIALIGVALGAALAPLLEWARDRRTRREQRRTELLELVAGLISAAGDRILAENHGTSTSPGPANNPDGLASAFRANDARWRLRLLAPADVAEAAENYGRACTALTRHLRTAANREDEEHDACIAWGHAAENLVTMSRRHLKNP